MEKQVIEIPVDQIDTPTNIRTVFEEAPLIALGQNMEAVGQLMPIIVSLIAATGRFLCIDGGRRVRGACLVGRKTLLAWVLDHVPTALELHLIQMCIAVHNVAVSAMEKSDKLMKIKTETGYSISRLAEELNMPQPQVSKLLKYQDACLELQAELRTGGIDQDKAYTICQEPDHVKQRELLKEAGSLTRIQLRQKTRGKGQPVDLKSAIARFPLSSGLMVSVQGRKVNLAGAIEAMLEAVKELKKGQAEHWDITTAMRVMRDRCKAHS